MLGFLEEIREKLDKTLIGEVLFSTVEQENETLESGFNPGRWMLKRLLQTLRFDLKVNFWSTKSWV